MNKKLTFLCTILFYNLLVHSATAVAQSAGTIVIKANQVVSTIQPTMWGVFFEDINLGADGGIYAELVKNRSFEFYNPMMGWTKLGKQYQEGDFLIQNRSETDAVNPRYLRVSSHDQPNGGMGLKNEGFRGMGVKQGVGYNFSVMYRQQKPGVKLMVELVDSNNTVIGGATLTPTSVNNQWSKQSVSFTAKATVLKASLNIWFTGNGVIDLDMISLFPQDTWKNRPGGMRADMIQKLADLKPGFIRFPGGCIVEGYDLKTRYQWKKTIGPVEDRHLIINRWNTEFAHRPAPDYYQTFGLGFYEYFQLAEDIGAEPLPILNAGMACQFNSAEVVPMTDIEPYVQDALDLIEFANGSADSKWGKVRAGMGHPEPFNLKMLGIGNENWGPQYVERLKVFTKAIKDKYPNIKLDYSSGTDPAGDRFDYLNNVLRKMNADIIDEHYYRKPEWFFENARRYDDYERNGPKIFAGEYAAQSDHTVSINNKNNWLTALSEAAFMTGMERNAAVVNMASYAPLFAHVDGWQWTPDLIWVNNLYSYGTPNYYVQKLFSTNRGTHVLPMTLNGKSLAGADSLYGSASKDTVNNELIVKLVNASANQVDKTIMLDGLKTVQSTATQILLQSNNLEQVNSIENPVALSPKESLISVKNKRLTLTLAPYSFYVIKVKL